MPKTTSLPTATKAAANTARPAPALPETGFLRLPQVLAFVPISKSTLWRRIQAHTFPEPLKLSPRVTVWRAEDIRQWISQQIHAPDGLTPACEGWCSARGTVASRAFD